MGLEGIIRETKNFFVEQVWEYPGKTERMIGNGIKAGAGYLLIGYFDDISLKLLCGTYAAIKGMQFVKDIVKYIW